MVFLIGFYSKKNTQNDMCKKNHLTKFKQVDLDLPTWLGSQFGPYHFD